ncbi:MAG: bifunctional UDP-N-acetylmuramoyl-tripeptide:D-alanyl-D-alanine ligase/alanine racemase [Bacteroidales bacterium]|jgi:alanine racemase|nr:bifunctional UDP-N-acetylmuramoyl-tripeptide:D-alanyl-D-alanine ligase/alanine racemase [Bacteroidales bacterium]
MTVSELSSILKPSVTSIGSPDATFTRILTDSRKLTDADDTLFFAIRTKRNNGANYIAELYAKGVRNFVLCNELDESLQTELQLLKQANYWFVKDVVSMLQRLAEHHRKQFDIPVVGITGSNGKTIVKDWIVQLLVPDHHLVSSPKSYNSQIGVPLSVWQMGPEHDFAVFEAGISETGKMEALKNVIRPTIGIFTNIGQAHDENFLTRYQKIAEKLQLFTHCEVLIYCSDHKDIHSVVSEKESLRQLNRFTWGSSDEDQVKLQHVEVLERSTMLKVIYNAIGYDMEIPFVDRASIENAMHCISLLFYLGYDGDDIAERCSHLLPVAMRLEMDEGINNCLLINDSYSLDINSLSIALDFLQHEHQHYHKTLIMSDFMQSGVPEQELYSQVSSLIRQRGITKLVGIGEALQRNRAQFEGIETFFYPSTDEFIRQHPAGDFQNETILLKGARVFGFENIAKLLQRKSHETIMEVNLDALVSNVNYYRSRINSSTRLMAMVKASSYGAGKVEVANTLQFNHVDYLTVAYCDEGVELRRNGIKLPIMVMNPEEESFDSMIRYELEPDIYSFRILQLFSDTARLYTDQANPLSIHIELDTGMHRLGFSAADMPELARRLKQADCPLRVKSVFSHLACSEDPAMDDFTHRQIDLFRQGSSQLKQLLSDDSILCHILNSSGITRFPEAQMDMVRLGIGLYGISPEPEVQKCLAQVSTLKTRISQIKPIPKDDSVGYNRRWIAQRDSRIAIIPIGYADGLSRHLGYGNGSMEVNGHMAPIIGSICMDMCFLDVTDIECEEGDEVVIFGSAESLCRMAEASGTIPYEILTSVSPRVKRVYVSDN